MILMLDAYLRNGELFLEDMGITEITEDVVRGNYLLPIREMIANLAPVESDSEAIALLRKFGFELSGKTQELLPSLIPNKPGTCSICGKGTRVVLNKAFIFPFERKVDSIVNEKNRLTFCMEHAFKLYSAMANVYTVPVWDSVTLRFFFDSSRENLADMNNFFREGFWSNRLEIERKEEKKIKYSVRVRLEMSKYHPNEAFFAIMHSFVKHLHEAGLLRRAEDIAGAVDVHVVYGSGQFYEHRLIKGSTFERLIRFVDEIQRAGMATTWGRRHLGSRDAAVVMFYESLEIPRGKADRTKNFLEREEFFKKLLAGSFDFILLNRIFMERLKHGLPLPPYYHRWARSYLEVFGGDILDAQAFERINGLGYALGKAMKGTNLERYQWELFRARGFEEFLNKLVELQAKLELSLDLRPIYENEREWKVVKAVLLNGMLNALHGRGKEESK